MNRLLALALVACTSDPAPGTDTGLALPPDRVGDPEVGWEVLRYGDFVGAGVPSADWFELVGVDSSNLLDREGPSADIPESFNLFDAPNGVEVVGGITCFGCHGGSVDGQFVPGLGNTHVDFTGMDDVSFYTVLGSLIEAKYGAGSDEWDAYWPLQRGAEAIGPYIPAPFAGINTEFSFERAAVAWRDPETLEWLDAPRFEVPLTPIASDTPAWWHAKKKSRLYHSGGGQGDFARLISQISVVAITDVDQLAAIDETMPHVLAWIEALEAPPYPREVDAQQAEAGRAVFEATCSRCHGTYGEVETYPDLVVDLDEVGTDPAYALAFLEPPEFVDWLRESWFADGPYAAVFEPSLGYVAPPLDGVWATAPYFHNGSVPDLAGVLDSSDRPTFWRRDFGTDALDHDRMGQPWEPADAGGAWDVYDTTLPGFGNGGHTFGDALTADERASLIVYLKTL